MNELSDVESTVGDLRLLIKDIMSLISKMYISGRIRNVFRSHLKIIQNILCGMTLNSF